MTDEPFLFNADAIPVLPSHKERDFKSIQFPVWSEQKARLIQEYLRLFTFVTKHGTYIDGFAAPQRRDAPELCSAALVMESEPKWIRRLFLCDIDPIGADLLRAIAIKNAFPNRKIEVVEGNFNEIIADLLANSGITEKTATFALLDQRTFECSWSSVRSLALFKKGLNPTANKIELFYFLASGWLDRSIAAVRLPETASKLDAWWGGADWAQLRGMHAILRARLVAERFKSEFGYKFALPYAIHNLKRGGRTMYHMIHATDHEEAPLLMLRAYRKVSGRSDMSTQAAQTSMDSLWGEMS